MEDGGAEALLNKAKEAVTRLQAAKAAGQNVDAQLSIAEAQVAAEQSVVDAVKAATSASSDVAQAASSAASEAAQAASEVAKEAAQEASQVAQAAAKEVSESVRAEKNVVQLIQYSDGSVHVLVSKTGVNLSHGQTIVHTGLTDAAANSAWGCDSNNSGHSSAAGACAEHRKAISEAEAASGIKVTGGLR